MQLLQMRKPVLKLRGLHGSGPIRLALALVTVMMAVTLWEPPRAMSQESLCSLAARHDGNDPSVVCGGEPLVTADKSLDERMQRDCRQGNIDSCRRFGLVKLKAQEFSDAVSLLGYACNAGAPTACTPAAVALDAGGRRAEAVEPLTLACNADDPKACLLLGALLYEQHQMEQGRVALAKACERGSSVACVHDFYAGVAAAERGDIGEAAQFYRLACSSGVNEGCNNLGNIEQEKGNTDEAARLYKLACDGGVPLGCTGLGWHEQEKGNKDEAARLYKLACDGGATLGCNNLGVIEQANGNKGEAARLYKLACDGGEALGCNNLGALESRQDAGNAVGEGTSPGAEAENSPEDSGAVLGPAAAAVFVGVVVTLLLILLVTLARAFATSPMTETIVDAVTPWVEIVAEGLPMTKEEEASLAEMSPLVSPFSIHDHLAEVLVREGDMNERVARKITRAKGVADAAWNRWTMVSCLIAALVVALYAVTLLDMSIASSCKVAGLSVAIGLVAFWLLGETICQGLAHWTRYLSVLKRPFLLVLLSLCSFTPAMLATYLLAAHQVLADRWLFLAVGAFSLLFTLLLVMLWKVFGKVMVWNLQYALGLTPRFRNKAEAADFAVPVPWARDPEQLEYLRLGRWPGRKLTAAQWVAAIAGRIVPTSIAGAPETCATLRSALSRNFDVQNDEVEAAMQMFLQSLGTDESPHLIVRRMMMGQGIDVDRWHRRWHATLRRTELPDHYQYLPEKVLSSLAFLTTELDLWDSMESIYFLTAGLFYIEKDEACTIAEEAVASVSGAADLSMADALRILGCSPDSDLAEIKQNYRKLVAKYHPDRLDLGNLPDDMVQLAKQRFQEIRNAYERIAEMRREQGRTAT